MSWPTVSLGEVVDLRTGPFGSALHQHDYVAGGVPLINPTHIRDGRFTPDDAVAVGPEKFRELREFSVDVGDVLMGRRGEMGRCAVVTEAERGWLCGTGSIIVRPTTKIDPKFLQRFLSAPATARALEGDSVGTTMINLNQKILLALKVALPPLPEQRRIAAILDKADALRAKRREAIAKLDQLLQSVFLDMFGDPVTNPKGWPQTELHHFADPSDRVNYGVVQPGDQCDGGAHIVRVGDIEGGAISRDNLKQISPEIEAAYIRSRLKGNELLISCVGSIGVVAEVPAWAVGFNIARALTRVPLANPRQRPFVREMLRTTGVQRYFAEKTRTVSQPTLNVEFVKAAPVIVPPTDLIENFCSISKKAALTVDRTEKAQAATGHLFSSIQQAAFTRER